MPTNYNHTLISLAHDIEFIDLISNRRCLQEKGVENKKQHCKMIPLLLFVASHRIELKPGGIEMREWKREVKK